MPDETRTTAGRALPALLVRFWIAMAALTALSILWAAITTHLYGLAAPYDLPLQWGDGLFGDFLVFRAGFAHYGTPQFWRSFNYPFTYPAPLAIVFGWLYKLAHPVRTYLLLCFVALGVGAYALVRALVARSVAPLYAWLFVVTTVPMLWPLIFFFCDANVEGIVVILMACGVIAVLRDRYWLGAALLGIAGDMKIFPFVLLGLVLARRRYKEFAFGIVVAAVVMVASLHTLGPSIIEAQRNIDIGLALVKTKFIFSLARIAPEFDHSLWIPFRFAAISLNRLIHPAPGDADTAMVLERSLQLYLLLSALAGVTLFFTIIRKRPILNQVLALTSAAVLLPPLSLEYTLLHLLLPFALLCAYATDMARRPAENRNAAPLPGLGLCFACFVLIFNANSFLNQRYVFAAEGRLIGLIVLLVAALRYPFHWAELGSPEKAAA